MWMNHVDFKNLVRNSLEQEHQTLHETINQFTQNLIIWNKTLFKTSIEARNTFWQDLWEFKRLFVIILIINHLNFKKIYKKITTFSLNVRKRSGFSNPESTGFLLVTETQPFSTKQHLLKEEITKSINSKIVRAYISSIL